MADRKVTALAGKSDLEPTGAIPLGWVVHIQAGILLVLGLLAPLAPRSDVVFLFLLGAVCIVHVWLAERKPGAIFAGEEQRWLLIAMFALSGYLFINALWAENVPSALGKAGFFLLLVLIVLSAQRSFSHQRPAILDWTAKLLVAGLIVGTAIACFEFATGHTLERMLYTALPAIRPGEKSIDVFTWVNGELVRVAEEEFRKHYDNVVIRVWTGAKGQNTSLLLLLLWPALYLASHLRERRISLAATLLIAGLSVALTYLGYSQTAQAALIASLLVFLVAKAWPRVARWCVLAAWCVAVTLAVPLSGAPYKAGLHKAEWLFNSARDRIVIWNFTVEQMGAAPILGTGIRSTRYISRKLKAGEERVYDQVAYRRLGLHSHNHFLQVWYELGAIGAFLVLLSGIGIIHLIGGLSVTLKPYAYAAFAAACVIAAFGWGLWQTWLLSGYAFSMVLMALASQWSKRERHSV